MSAPRPSQWIAHVGGVFIYSADASALAEWYREVFDLPYEYTQEFQAFYYSFYYTDNEKSQRYLVWSILQSKDHPAHEPKSYCINYRVYDLEAFVEHLKLKSIEVKGIEVQPEGKFAWIHDPDGNYIELWEESLATA
jgi:predicted enzyme related to lactoylglutathione lyase